MRHSDDILTEIEQILIWNLSKGDMIAQEAKYHATCLVVLHGRAEPFQLG